MEKDDEIKGNGNSYDFGARMYDGRIGRWLSIDPLERSYPNFSPYMGIGNNPIYLTDLDGRILRDKDGNIIVTMDSKTKYVEEKSYDTKNFDGTISKKTLQWTKMKGVIYNNNGDEIEVIVTLSSKTITKNYSKNGSLISTNSVNDINRNQIDNVADCYGLTIADNKLWINNYKEDGSENVGLLIDTEWYEVDDESVADVVVFRAAQDKDGGQKKGEIIHSAKRNSNGSYKSNAGNYPAKNNLTLDEAAGKAFGGKTMTDITKQGTVEFYQHSGDDKINTEESKGTAIPNNKGLKNYSKEDVKISCDKGGVK